jgi:DNA-binding MarR family transcriptional regulator
MPLLHESAIGYVIGRSCHIMRKAFNATFGKAGHDITPEEWGLLNRLHERDGQRQAELADATIRDRTTVTRLLDGMVQKGLVRRKADPDDRRAVQTWLTKKGRSMRRKLIPVAEELLHRATRDISDQELQTTVATLRKLQANLVEERDKPSSGDS